MIEVNGFADVSKCRNSTGVLEWAYHIALITCSSIISNLDMTNLHLNFPSGTSCKIAKKIASIEYA